MSTLTAFNEVIIWGGFALRIAGNLLLALAFLMWCRRLRHWSMGVLALTFLMSAGLNALSLAMWSMRRTGSGSSAPLNDAWMFLQQIGGLATAALLMAGALGFLIAARQLSLVRDDEASPPPAPSPSAS
jgi:hypothetical protein